MNSNELFGKTLLLKNLRSGDAMTVRFGHFASVRANGGKPEAMENAAAERLVETKRNEGWLASMA